MTTNNKPKTTNLSVVPAKDKIEHSDNKPGILSRFINSVKSKNVPIKAEKETTEEVEAPEQADDLQNFFARQLADYKYAPVAIDDYVKPITFVTASNGVFRVVKTDVAIYKTFHKEVENKIVGLEEMEEGVELLIPKIPFRHILRALTFFRDVLDKDRTESSLLFFWNTDDKELPAAPGFFVEGKLVAYCPVQENQYSLTDFTKDTVLPWLRSELGLLLELHSHCDFSAFFSGTDNANENMNQFYGVWGYVNHDDPMFAFRWVSGDVKRECSPDILIDWPTITETELVQTRYRTSIELNDPDGLIDIEEGDLEVEDEIGPLEKYVETELVKGPFKRVEYPAEWLSTQHKKHTFQYKYPTYNKGGAKKYSSAKQTTLDYDEKDFDYYRDYYGGSIYDNLPGYDEYYGTDYIKTERVRTNIKR